VQTGVNLRRLAGSRRDRRVRGTGRGAEFPRARYREVRVLTGGGDDGLGLTSPGEVPITFRGGPGNDGVGVSGTIDDTGVGDGVAVEDLSSTDVVRFTPDFSAFGNGTEPNNSADTLTVRGTPGVDDITITGAKQDITVAGLTPTVTPLFLAPDDFLLIQTLAGDDTVDSSGLPPGLEQPIVQ
jgi:hypothetical protein